MDAREGWKPDRLATEPKSSSALCDHLIKDFIFARDLVGSQERTLTYCLHQKPQYSESVGWETFCEGWPSEEAHCFGAAFIFHTQILNAAVIPPETKMFPQLCERAAVPLQNWEPTAWRLHLVFEGGTEEAGWGHAPQGPRGLLPCSARELLPLRGVLSPPGSSKPSQLGVSEGKQAASL